MKDQRSTRLDTRQIDRLDIHYPIVDVKKALNEIQYTLVE